MEAYSSARFWPKDDSTIIGSVHVKIAPTVSSVDSSSPHATSSQGRYARIDGVVEQEAVGVLAGDSGLGDQLGERTCPGDGIETGLRDAGVLRSNDLRRYQRESRTLLRRRGTDDAMEPL